MKLFYKCRECKDTGMMDASPILFRVWMYGEMLYRKQFGEKIFLPALDLYRAWKKSGKIPCVCK